MPLRFVTLAVEDILAVDLKLNPIALRGYLAAFVLRTLGAGIGIFRGSLHRGSAFFAFE